MFLGQNPIAKKSWGHVAVFLTCLASGLSACASSPKVTQSVNQAFEVPPTTEILLLRPKVTYEEAENRDLRPAEPVDDGGVAGWLEMLTLDSMEDNGLSATLWANEKAEAESDRLVRKTLKGDAARELLADACLENEDTAVLVQYLRVKIDSEIYGKNWLLGRVMFSGFYFGPGKTDLSSSHLRAVLRSCTTGKVIWRNSVFIRDLPRIKTPEFDNAVTSMFESLDSGTSL